MFVFPNKAHSAVLRAIVRMQDASAFRRGTLGRSTRNARRLAAGMRRAALRDQRTNVLAVAEGLLTHTRWPQ